MKISILTPTYNRAKFLKQLYDSIVENLDHNIKIEWLIMDDGSTDDTPKIIEDYRKEEKIEIKYYYQENQGKMIAINKLVKETTGDMIVDCDSDDYFIKNAFTIIEEQWKKNKHRKDVYGICFLKYNTKGKNMGNRFKNQETTMFDLYFKEGETGEKAIVFFSEVRKKFQHELEKNERFITEARMYHKMDKQYKMIAVNQPIIICEYQEEGYTSNINKQFKENPYGYYEYFKEILQNNFKGIKFSKRLYVIKHYILFTYLTKQYQSKSIKSITNKVLYYMLFLPGMIKSRKFVGT